MADSKTSAAKTDFKKTMESYAPGRTHEWRLLEVPPLDYLMVDGHGDPGSSPEFAAAIAALYPVAYKLKFLSRAELGRDYVVMPLEGLWSADDPAAFTTARDKSRWNWTLMIMVPEWTTGQMVEHAVSAASEAAGSKRAGSKRAGGSDDEPPPWEAVRFERLEEGLSAQTLHVGSFDDEAEILQELHETYLPQSGCRPSGIHHEIYLSDFRKVEPARLRTILRQPVGLR